jgi:hypothetical protein
LTERFDLFLQTAFRWRLPVFRSWLQRSVNALDCPYYAANAPGGF